MRPPKSASNAGETTIAIAASKGDGIATYGIAILNGQELSVCFQALPDTTPNEMNLLAALSVMGEMPDGSSVTICSTLGYLRNSVNQLGQMAKDGWTRADGKPLAHTALLQNLKREADRINVTAKSPDHLGMAGAGHLCELATQIARLSVALAVGGSVPAAANDNTLKKGGAA